MAKFPEVTIWEGPPRREVWEVRDQDARLRRCRSRDLLALHDPEGYDRDVPAVRQVECGRDERHFHLEGRYNTIYLHVSMPFLFFYRVTFFSSLRKTLCFFCLPYCLWDLLSWA